jgi:hypothetical protein
MVPESQGVRFAAMAQRWVSGWATSPPDADRARSPHRLIPKRVQPTSHRPDWSGESEVGWIRVANEAG